LVSSFSGEEFTPPSMGGSQKSGCLRSDGHVFGPYAWGRGAFTPSPSALRNVADGGEHLLQARSDPATPMSGAGQAPPASSVTCFFDHLAAEAADAIAIAGTERMSE